MTDLLDKIDSALAKVEVRLQLAFNRIRQSESEEPYSTLSNELHSNLETALKKLKRALDNSGRGQGLQLATERHDDLRIRIGILSHLLDKKIATGYIHQASEQTSDVREELAALANLVVENEDMPPPPVPTGKAHFRSKDLSHTIAPALPGKPKASIAQSPEEIARKLAERGAAQGTGPSQFAARELKSTHVISGQTMAPIRKKEPREIAHSPDEIRKKLGNRKADAGPANFISKDIEPVAPPTAPSGPVFLAPEEEEEDDSPRTGKASFDSKDLSRPGFQRE